MKKISKYLLFLLIIFIGFNVKALDNSYCSNSNTACAICEYIINDGTNTRVVFNVKATTSGTVEFDQKVTNGKGAATVSTTTVAANNFYSKANDKLTCPSTLKTGMVSTGRDVAYYASFTSDKVNNVTLNGRVALNESYNNDKNVTPKGDELHSCTYRDDNSNVSIEVQYNQSSLKYDSDGYTVTYTDFTVNDFQGGCPVAYLTCTSRGNSCSLKKNPTGNGSTSTVTPTDTSNADQIENPTQSSQLGDTNSGTPVYDCEGLIGPNVLAFLELILSLIMIVGPIIALTLGTYDIFMAMAKGEEDDKKKAFKKLRGRLIATVLLLILPYIIKLLLTLINKGDSMCL